MKPKEEQSKLGPRNLVPLLPCLRASGSSESEAPCRQDAPPSQPQRLSCGAPRPYRSRNRDGGARQRRRRASLSRIQSQRGITRRPRLESFLPAGGGPGRSPRALAAVVRQGRGLSWHDGVSGGVQRGEVSGDGVVELGAAGAPGLGLWGRRGWGKGAAVDPSAGTSPLPPRQVATASRQRP